MGYSISWLMVRGGHRQNLLKELGLEPTARLGEAFDFEIAGHQLPSGDYLLTLEKCDHPFVSDKHLKQLSAGSIALGCSIEEHVMFAHVTYWENGKKLWSLKHEGDTPEGRNTVVVSGNPPDFFQAVRDEYAAKQPGDPDVDWYFETVPAVAKRLSGFRHDEANPSLDGSFEELRIAKRTSGDRRWRKLWDRN